MARKPGTTRKPAGRSPAKPRPTNAEPEKAGAGKEPGADSGTSAWEWAVAAVGAVILAGIIGFLVNEGLSGPDGAAPAIVVAGEAPVRLATGRFLVPIRVVNEGRVTGANVTVRGELRDPGGALVEESTATFDFVAQHSAETGGLYFTVDPATLRLALRVEGYTDP
jgi:uncharacterized protein (TIGR02588 family)